MGSATGQAKDRRCLLSFMRRFWNQTFWNKKKKWKFSLIVPGSKDGGCVYLDGRLLETQLSGQFTTTGPGHVVFLEKFLLQTSQLFTSEGSSVAAHWSRIVQRVASLNVLIGRFWNNKKKQENFSFKCFHNSQKKIVFQNFWNWNLPALSLLPADGEVHDSWLLDKETESSMSSSSSLTGVEFILE